MVRSPCMLIVDNEESLRYMLTRRLQRRGAFTIVEADDGPQALAPIVRQPVELVILDLGLPGMEWLEVVRRIRALPPPTGRVPILIFSAYPASQYEPQAHAVGCQAYVEKPADFEAFYATVQQLLMASTAPPL